MSPTPAWTSPTPDEHRQNLLRFWAKELCLSHWEIALRVVRQHDMPTRAPANGCCRRNPESLQALIHLLDPVDYNTSAFAVDEEVTLVHELLHVYHWNENPGSASELLEEQGCEVAARALVRLRRLADHNAQATFLPVHNPKES